MIAEWEYKKEKHACFFIDSGRKEIPETNTIFRPAVSTDTHSIRKVTGKFFDDKSGGFSSLEERIAAGMIFVLENKKDLLGGGIIEKGMICRDYASIGMFVNRDFRGQDYAPLILLKLKEWCYQHDLKPIAGCWYNNTLSRKSLEAAGMIAVSIGFEAILKGKEKLPLRTGNPPGEPVAEKKGALAVLDSIPEKSGIQQAVWIPYICFAYCAKYLRACAGMEIRQMEM